MSERTTTQQRAIYRPRLDLRGNRPVAERTADPKVLRLHPAARIKRTPDPASNEESGRRMNEAGDAGRVQLTGAARAGETPQEQRMNTTEMTPNATAQDPVTLDSIPAAIAGATREIGFLVEAAAQSAMQTPVNKAGLTDLAGALARQAAWVGQLNDVVEYHAEAGHEAGKIEAADDSILFARTRLTMAAALAHLLVCDSEGACRIRESLGAENCIQDAMAEVGAQIQRR